jgi:3-(3-hydroxy-phenyl)propionate hydroxylase
MKNVCAVLIAGFGPSGAVAASLFGQLGIETLCVDKSDTVYAKPRAIAVDHEIMRVFQSIGVAEQVSEHIAVFPASEYYGVQGQLIKRIDAVPAPYPLGYTPTMVFSQPPVEAVLRENATKYPSVEVSLATELVSFTQHDDGVLVQLRDGQGELHTVSCQYLIACDGASSTVRTKLNIGYEDLDFDEPWLVVDVKVNAQGIERLPKVAIQYCEPSRPCSYIVGPGGHRRWEIMLQEDEDPLEMQKDQAVWKLLERWMTPSDGELWRAASYRFHALVAKQWRIGRVFIAGDAAHQQPPFIGQGMCQGIRDVVNLAWKIDMVLKGQAGNALLDTYEVERSAHVKTLTGRIKDIGRLICERDVAAATARDDRLIAESGGVIKTITRQEIVPPLQTGLLSRTTHPANGTIFPQPWIKRLDSSARFDSFLSKSWHIVVSYEFVVSDAVKKFALALDVGLIRVQRIDKPHSERDEQVLGLMEQDGIIDRWFSTHLCGAALVRPDRYVFGVSATSDELLEQLKALEEELV